jgi:NitT/TauT family transport system substrate-binding protein
MFAFFLRVPFVPMRWWNGTHLHCGLLLLALCFISACSKKTENSTDSGKANSKLTKVRLALNWYPEPEHGGFYTALVEGYYEAEGLDVEILAGGPGAPVAQQLIREQVEFAVANADYILEVNNQDAQLVAVMAPMQDSPRCMMVHEDSGITELSQLNQADLMIAVGSGLSFFEYLKTKVPLDQPQLVQYNGRINEFLLNKKLVQQAYNFSEPFVAEQNGAKTRCIMLSDIGFNPYTSCLTSTKKYTEANEAIVRKMVTASVRGWQTYLRDPVKTNAEINKLNPQMDLPSLQFGVEKIRTLCLPQGETSPPMGSMTADRWKTLAEQLIEIKQLKPGYDHQQAFRVDFLPTPSKE